jgi:diguanylate cyclase (GGDEF)-like protein
MTWTFDIRSALLMGALLTVVVGGILMLASRSLPASYRSSLRWWVAATLMLPASFVMLSLRDVAPAWFVIVLGNGLMASSFACYAIALEEFNGLVRRHLHLWLLVAAVAGVSLWLGVIQPNLPLRLALVAMLSATLLGRSVWIIYRAPGSSGQMRHIAGAVLALSAAILLYRAGTMFLEPNRVTSLFSLGHVQVLTYAVGSVLPVVGTLGFLLMCTERSQRELERAARVDFLTGCYNRRAIDELGLRAIAAARRHGMPLAVLVLDIDHFKRINDELGHAVGDAALVASVARIREALRAEDVLGRLGGEEFIVLMPNTDMASAVSAGERIRVGFCRLPLVMDGHRRAVTLSIGVATLAPADRQFSQLLQRGDRAMYAAKNAGRNLVMADAMSGWEAPLLDQTG